MSAPKQQWKAKFEWRVFTARHDSLADKLNSLESNGWEVFEVLIDPEDAVYTIVVRGRL